MASRLSPGAESLVALAVDEFGFLTELGAAPRRRQEGSLLTTVSYVFPSISIELSFEWLDAAFFVFVSRTVAGIPAPGYLVHENRLVRFHLQRALQETQPAEQRLADRLKKATIGVGEDSLRRQIIAYAEVSRACIDRLLEHGTEIFDELERQDRAEATKRPRPPTLSEVFLTETRQRFGFLESRFGFRGREVDPHLVVFELAELSVSVGYLGPEQPAVYVRAARGPDAAADGGSISCLYTAAGLGDGRHIKVWANTAHLMQQSLRSNATALRKLLPLLTGPQGEALLRDCLDR